MANQSLYSFERLRSYIERIGVRLDGNSNFEFKWIDFNKVIEEDIVSFDEDKGSIELHIQGTNVPGFVYIKEYYISRYNAFPKFHITVCETIQEFMNEGRFRRRYLWASEPKVPVVNADTGEEYEG